MKTHPGGYLVKLVRDRVADVLGGDGTVTYRRMSREEHVERLRAKLIEEAAEYVTKPSLRELAHVLAVVWALARLDLGTTPAAVEEKMIEEAAERGGFENGVGMYVLHPYDTQGATP